MSFTFEFEEQDCSAPEVRHTLLRGLERDVDLPQYGGFFWLKVRKSELIVSAAKIICLILGGAAPARGPAVLSTKVLSELRQTDGNNVGSEVDRTVLWKTSFNSTQANAEVESGKMFSHENTINLLN